MSDPLVDFPRDVPKKLHKGVIDEYSKETLDEYKRLRTSFTKYPLWHYSQLETKFNNDSIQKILVKFAIPTENITVTVFGGYTGEFASCLRDIGMRVIFTDPEEDWVIQATNQHFESYRYSVQTLPKEIIKKTDLFATFECYPALHHGPSENYDIMRLLTAKYGIFFAESKRTIEQMDKKYGVPGATLKVTFLPFKRTYGIKRAFTYTENKELRLHHFCANQSQRQLIKTDCRVMKDLYDSFPDIDLYEQFYLNREIAISHARLLDMEPLEWQHSIRRILDLYQPCISDPYRRALYHLDEPNVFRIHNKEFTIDTNLLKPF